MLVPNRRLRFRRMSFRGCVLFGYVFVRYVLSGYRIRRWFELIVFCLEETLGCNLPSNCCSRMFSALIRNHVILPIENQQKKQIVATGNIRGRNNMLKPAK